MSAEDIALRQAEQKKAEFMHDYELQHLWDRAHQATNQKGSKEDKRQADEQLMTKLQNRFNERYLNDIFTVDIQDTENSIKMKCMPSSYSNVIKSIDTLYKVFAQTYIDSRSEGLLDLFVCDFLQDANGRFHFLKINEFQTDGKPVCSENWKISKKFIDRVQDSEKKILQGSQVCSAQILCKK